MRLPQETLGIVKGTPLIFISRRNALFTNVFPMNLPLLRLMLI